MVTRGGWCGQYERQVPIPSRPPPRGSKTCPKNCKGVGNSNYDIGVCEFPAGGWVGGGGETGCRGDIGVCECPAGGVGEGGKTGCRGDIGVWVGGYRVGGGVWGLGAWVQVCVCVCVHVRACVRMRGRAGVRACGRVCGGLEVQQCGWVGRPGTVLGYVEVMVMLGLC